jgi:hypothetical protein
MTPFKDRNFKRVLALQLSANKGDDAELAAVVDECGALEDDTDKIHRKVLALLDARDLSRSSLESVRAFSIETYRKGVETVLPFWSGEGDPLPIKSFVDLEKLPNLEVFDYPVSEEAVVGANILPNLPRLKRVCIYHPPNGKAVKALLGAGFKVTSRDGDVVVMKRSAKQSPRGGT